MFGVTYIGSNYKQNKTNVKFLINTWEFIQAKQIIWFYKRRNSMEAKNHGRNTMGFWNIKHLNEIS